MIFQAISTRYCATVSRPLSEETDFSLYWDLTRLAYDVEFDGVFGPRAVLFSLSPGDNTLERHDQIRQVFKKYNVRVVS